MVSSIADIDKPYYKELLGWVKDTVQQLNSESPNDIPSLSLFGKDITLVKINGKPDMYDDRHAALDEVQSFFVAEGEPDIVVASLPEGNLDYAQLFFRVPVDPQQAATMQEQRAQWAKDGTKNIDENDIVGADIAIEITPNYIHVSGWNGLNEQPTYEADKDTAEFDFDYISLAINPPTSNIAKLAQQIIESTQTQELALLIDDMEKQNTRVHNGERGVDSKNFLAEASAIMEQNPTFQAAFEAVIRNIPMPPPASAQDYSAGNVTPSQDMQSPPLPPQ